MEETKILKARDMGGEMQLTGGQRNTDTTSSIGEQFSPNYSPGERKEEEIFQLKFTSLLYKVLEKDQCSKRSSNQETDDKAANFNGNILSSDSTEFTGSPLTNPIQENGHLKLEDHKMEMSTPVRPQVFYSAISYENESLHNETQAQRHLGGAANNEANNETNNEVNGRKKSYQLHQPHQMKKQADSILKPSKPPQSQVRTGIQKNRKLEFKKVSIKTPIATFRASSDAYTPKMRHKVEYCPAALRTPQRANMGTISRPNFRDALRRVAMIIQQHIQKIESRFENGVDQSGLFDTSMRELFTESNYITKRFKCTPIYIPMAKPGIILPMKEIKHKPILPTCDEIYHFAHQLFKQVQLSSECSIVCLIYVERLMEVAKVPLLADTWRPIFLCGLLLASKVWQDLSSWNVEFATVYPQYTLDAINKLELLYLKMAKWNLHISTSLYAKYYFALRSLLEKKDFRQRYNGMVGGVGNVGLKEAIQIEKRTDRVKQEAMLHFSRSI